MSSSRGLVHGMTQVTSACFCESDSRLLSNSATSPCTSHMNDRSTSTNFVQQKRGHWNRDSSVHELVGERWWHDEDTSIWQADNEQCSKSAADGDVGLSGVVVRTVSTLRFCRRKCCSPRSAATSLIIIIIIIIISSNEKDNTTEVQRRRNQLKSGTAQQRAPPLPFLPLPSPPFLPPTLRSRPPFCG